MDQPDEYTGIFDDLTPDDFLLATSAVGGGEITRNTAPAFDEFVDEQLRMIATAWIAAETWIQPLAVIADHSKQRMFVPEEDETLGQFVDRVHREAKAMGAIWTFVSKRTQVASIMSAENFDVENASQEAWDEAQAAGKVRLGLVWYAERVDGPMPRHRHGQMWDEGNVLSAPKEGASDQRIPLFEKILNG